VRPAPLFLLGQPRFGIFVNDMWRGSLLLCASDLYLWCGVGFRMICSVHRLLLLLYGRQACADAARQLLIVHFIFLNTAKCPAGKHANTVHAGRSGFPHRKQFASCRAVILPQDGHIVCDL
jgi:hypothetical protein